MPTGHVDIVDLVSRVNLLAVVEHDAPTLAGTFNGKYTREVACPKCGGETRFRVRLRADGVMRAYCSHCAEKGLNAVDYLQWRDGLTKEQAIQWWTNDTRLVANLARPKSPPLQPIDMAIAEGNHRLIEDEQREYLYQRGMTDPWINHFKVGYHGYYRRYSFPFIIDDRCWGIQYRIDPRMEWVLKYLAAFGIEYPILRYLSEKGSHNHGLFACGEIHKPWPYAILIEGVADTIAMWSLGFPTVCTFQGNNKHKPWDSRWNKYLEHVNNVVVVPDNDGDATKGELFAKAKVEALGLKAHLHWLPPQYKDVGEMIMADVTTARERISRWLAHPPALSAQALTDNLAKRAMSYEVTSQEIR